MSSRRILFSFVFVCVQLCWLSAASKAALDNLLAQKEVEVNRLFDQLNSSYNAFKCNQQVNFLPIVQPSPAQQVMTPLTYLALLLLAYLYQHQPKLLLAVSLQWQFIQLAMR